MASYLVTGGAGFIGSHLAEAFNQMAGQLQEFEVTGKPVNRLSIRRK